MERTFWNSTTILRGYDLTWTLKDVVAALGFVETDLAGVSTTVLAGFAAAPTAPASLTINLGAGRIYQQAPIDSNPIGPLASDPTLIQQQGIAAAQSVTFTTTALTSGQSQWALVQAQFSQVDQVRAGDPTNGIEQYFNTNNPSQPLQGQNNNGQPGPTVRRGLVSIQVIYGTPAATGSEVPPNPTNGWVPLYLVDLAFAQTTIIANQILVAGPSVGSNVPSNYPGAPILAGLLNQHHTGKAGQAPQIDLTAEVKNKLPLANMPASNTSGGLGTLRIGSGNPNGNLAGNFNVNGASDFYWDQVNLILYICTVTGSATTAVWTAVAGTSTQIFAGGNATGTTSAQVVASTTPAGFAKTPGQIVTFTGLNNPGSATLNVDGTGAFVVQKNTGGGNVNLTGGELNGFVSVIWTGTVYLLDSQILGTLATLNIGQWLKNDGAGNLTLNVDPSLQDNGSGKIQVNPTLLPPIGAVIPYAGSTVPSANWAFCNAQNISRTAFASLFSVLGITFGSGDGISTFTLPDLRGRVVAGVDTGFGRLTTNTMSSQSLGGTGGLETVSLSTAQMPSHSHANTLTDPGHTHALTDVNATNAVSFNHSGAIDIPGGGAHALQGIAGYLTTSVATGIAINNASAGSGALLGLVQPTMQLNYIIRIA